MKKRTIIAIIITIITIIATNKYWFVIRPLPVNFDILGHGTCNIEVQLNKKDNNEFKKVKSESVYINLDEKKHADVLVNRAKYPKRIKLILSNLSTNEPITISNIQFRDGRFTLENIEKFKVDGAKVVSKDNKLILTPNNDVITLIYPDTLHIRARMDFDFLVFGIILILVYLLAYKLSNYVAEFNTIKGKSRVEVIFLIVFFVFLLIPMIHMNKDDISLQENRTIAKWKPLIAEDNTINFEFGNNFNEWFNDRFYLRDMMLLDYQKLLYILSSNYYIQNNIAMNKKTNWMININLKNVDEYPQKKFSNERLEEISENISMLQDFCNKNNIKPYIIIAPYKAEFCAKLALPYLTHNLSMYDKTIQAIEYIKRKNGIQIIYPYEEIKNLFDEQPERAYFKSDHHWTDESAYLGYTKLMQQVKHDFQNIHITKENEYNFIYSKQVRVEPAINKFFIGMTARNANIRDEKILDTQYKYYIHKNSDNIKFRYLKAKDKDEIKYFYNNNINAPKMYMYGDSFDLNLLPIVVNSFSDSQVLYTSQVRKNILRLYEQDIIDNNTNVLIICVFDIDRLANLYQKEGN